MGSQGYTGGMKVKADQDESSPYAAQDVSLRCKEIGINAKTPGPGVLSALPALARSGMKIGRIGMWIQSLQALTSDEEIIYQIH